MAASSPNRKPVRAVWFAQPMPMLPDQGTRHINTGTGWAKWQVAVDLADRKIVISPPPTMQIGTIHVPFENVLAYQLAPTSVVPDFSG